MDDYLTELRRQLDYAEVTRRLTLSRDHRAELAGTIKRLRRQIAAVERNGTPAVVLDARCERCREHLIQAREGGVDYLYCASCRAR